MSGGELTRKERLRIQNREEILAVARQLVIEKGFQSVTIREIAALSEFSTGTIYNFFESKEALFSELLKKPAHDIHDAFIATLDSDRSEVQKLSDFIRCHNAHCIEYREGFKLYYIGLRSGGSMLSREVLDEIEGLRNNVGRQIREVFKSGIKRGVFRSLDPDAMLLVLRASLEALLDMLVEGVADETLRHYARQLEELFLGGILRGGRRYQRQNGA